MCYELFDPEFCMTSAIIFLARIVQNRSGLNLARIVARDVVEMRSTIFILRACQSIERT